MILNANSDELEVYNDDSQESLDDSRCPVSTLECSDECSTLLQSRSEWDPSLLIPLIRILLYAAALFRTGLRIRTAEKILRTSRFFLRNFLRYHILETLTPRSPPTLCSGSNHENPVLEVIQAPAPS